MWHSAIRAAGEIKNKTQVRKKQTQIVWESVWLCVAVCVCVVVYQCVCVLVVAIKSSTCVWTDGGIPFFHIFCTPSSASRRSQFERIVFCLFYSYCFCCAPATAHTPRPVVRATRTAPCRVRVLCTFNLMTGENVVKLFMALCDMVSFPLFSTQLTTATATTTAAT